MKRMGNKAIVLGISGNGLGIARSLGRRGIDVIAIADTNTSANLRSRYFSEKRFFYGNESELVDFLVASHGEFDQKPVLFPIRDATVLALAERIEEVRKFYHLVMPDGEVVKRALCKTSFSEMAEEFGLQVPRSTMIQDEDDLSRLTRDFKYPVIIKPEYRNDLYIANVAGKAFIAVNFPELLKRYAGFSEYQSEAIVQEYIPGTDSDLYFCFQYHTVKGDLAGSLCGRKIRQYPASCGSTCSCEVVTCPEVEEITTRFFRRIHYSGPGSMEFKRDPRDGRFYLIEPTIGRADWNNAFTEGNGIPIPYLNYLDALNLPLPRIQPKRIRRRWIRWSADNEASRIMWKRNELKLSDWISSVRPPFTSAIFALDDPMPSITGIMRRLKRKITK